MDHTVAQVAHSGPDTRAGPLSDATQPAVEGTRAAPDAWRGPYGELLVWQLVKPTGRVGSAEAARLGQALRRAVISRTAEPVPGPVSGHGAEDRPHLGYLTLPQVGRPHADGRVLGLALAVPEELSPTEWQQLARGVLLPPLNSLRVGKDWPELRLTHQVGEDWSLRAERWTAAPHGARQWATATPLLADGRLRRGRSPEDLVRRSLQKAGFPEPATVEAATVPLVEGAPWRAAAGSVPDRVRDLPRLHARITFEKPLVGPLFAGAMRYFGLGLFVPEEAGTGS